ncbi:MAG: hypothetical protein QOG62_403 [Thermoleophilaceae bacterium]|nr:hypothetical protein [Thermoleophilaceae bacterium]
MSAPRVGLVLGAGGIMGGAWLTGALDAITTESGWDPGTAEFIVGTSAGSMMAALLAGGVPPWFMVAHSAGRSFDGLVGEDGRPAAEADRAAGAEFKLQRALPPIGPGSLRLAARTLATPWRYTPATVGVGWLPRGVVSTEPLKDIVRRVTPTGWSDHPNLWVMACDYATGERVAFGRAGAPRVELTEAVAASCAIPAFYYPVEIGGRRYIDGGIRSTSNLDVLRGLDLDMVICLNPTSSRHPPRAWNPAEVVGARMNRDSGKRLGSEAKALRAEGTDVILIQPQPADLEAMGPNLMARRGRNRVIATAKATTAAQLHAGGIRELLKELPAGTPYMVREPDVPPEDWSALRADARAARFGRPGASQTS